MYALFLHTVRGPHGSDSILVPRAVLGVPRGISKATAAAIYEPERRPPLPAAVRP